MATSSAMETTTKDSPLNSTSNCHGLPLIFKAFKEAMKNYEVLSPHYTLSQPTEPREIASGSHSPLIALPPQFAKSMEEHVKMGLACASTSEWLLVAVSSILQLP